MERNQFDNSWVELAGPQALYETALWPHLEDVGGAMLYWSIAQLGANDVGWHIVARLVRAHLAGVVLKTAIIGCAIGEHQERHHRAARIATDFLGRNLPLRVRLPNWQRRGASAAPHRFKDTCQFLANWVENFKALLRHRVARIAGNFADDLGIAFRRVFYSKPAEFAKLEITEHIRHTVG